MAIKVQHGGRGSDTAGRIIAQAGQRSLDRQQDDARRRLDRQQSDAQLSQRLGQQRDMQMQQIGAAADRQRQAADEAAAQTAMQFGLEGQIKEQEFDRTIKMKQEEARLQANKFDYEFSQKSKQKIARINQAKQDLRTNLNFSQEEIGAGLRDLDRQLLGITEDAIPAREGKWTGDPKEAPGKAWVNASGGMSKRDKDGVEALFLKPAEMAEAIAAVAKAKIETAKVERAQAVEDNDTRVRLELLKEELSTGEFDAQNKPITRRRSLREVETLMRQAREGYSDNWWEREENRDMAIDSGDKELPEGVGYSKAFLRTLLKQYGNKGNVPEQYMEAMEEASRIFMSYQGGMPQQGNVPSQSGAQLGGMYRDATRGIY